MKTLADLKRNAHIYEWAMTKNSWYTALESRVTEWREVAETTTKQIGFKTKKVLTDGTIIPTTSWLDWPKASELTITQEGCHYVVTINRTIPADPNMQRKETIHTLQYHLRPNLKLIGISA